MYGKVFESMYDGTLAGHWEAIVTMQQFIVLSSPDGVVDMTPEAIAARTTIPIEIIQRGIDFLESPDPRTRTPGEDGKRIVLLDDHRTWGWRLVNHGKYMRLRNMEQKREDDRQRIEEKRKQIKDVATESRGVANVAHLDLDSDSKNKKPAALRRTSLPADFKVSERVKVWAKEKGFEAHLQAHLEKFVSSCKARGARYVDWDEALMNCIRDDWGNIRRHSTNGKKQEWWSTEEGIQAKAGELGLTIRRGETWTQLRGRINAAIEARK